MDGKLHKFNNSQVAFEFGNNRAKSTKCVVFIGGLGDGLLTVPYLSSLNDALGQVDFTLFQALLSSAYRGWGLSSLDRDARELKQLVQYLKEQEGYQTVFLMGHSTGCQDSIHFSLLNPDVADGIILQAPVSDRESLALVLGQAKVDELNKEAERLRSLYGDDYLLPNEFKKACFNTPVSVFRWLSLAQRGGQDDYFSSDLPDEELKQTFGKLTKPVLVLFSERDQYVPQSVDKLKLIKRWESAVDPKVRSGFHIVKNGCHNLQSLESFAEFTALVASFVKA